MKDDRYEIRFCGSGGQGIITTAIIFAEAAVYDGNFVSQTQSYGPEARGGKSKAEVVISAKEIDYPKVIQLDMLLAMNQESCDTYFFDFKPNGLLLVDSTFVEQLPTSRVISIPFTQLALDNFGTGMVANMIALGAVGYLCNTINLKSMEEALNTRIPKGTKTINRKAFHAGVSAAREVDLSHLPRSIASEDHEV